MNTKNAFSAAQNQVKKNGRRDGQQRYKCHDCGRQFNGGKRLQNDELWAAYSAGKQTAAQLAAQYGYSSKTIYRRLRSVQIRERYPLPEKANIIMDTTYFGRKWGVMVLYDARSKRALTVVAVERETNALYTQAVAALREKGVVIQSIICDGKSGLLDSFPDIPVQMCQFHQIKIIMRHLTESPKAQRHRRCGPCL